MVKITSPMGAEARARGFIKDRYQPRTVRRILIRRTSREDDVWLVVGNCG